VAMTPLAIEIMIECYRCTEPGANIPERIWNSEAATEARIDLIERGLIHEADHRATMLGEAYIGALMSVPVPKPECQF
jgi:hypothetical protein